MISAAALIDVKEEKPLDIFELGFFFNKILEPKLVLLEANVEEVQGFEDEVDVLLELRIQYIIKECLNLFIELI